MIYILSNVIFFLDEAQLDTHWCGSRTQNLLFVAAHGGVQPCLSLSCSIIEVRLYLRVSQKISLAARVALSSFLARFMVLGATRRTCFQTAQGYRFWRANSRLEVSYRAVSAFNPNLHAAHLSCSLDEQAEAECSLRMPGGAEPFSLIPYAPTHEERVRFSIIPLQTLQGHM